MSSTASSPKPWRGLQLREREESHIREALIGVVPAIDQEDADVWVGLWSYARKERLGLSALAQQTHIGSSILSQGFNGTYAGNYHEIAERIRAFFYRREQSRLYGGLSAYCATRLAQTLCGTFDIVRAVRRIQFIEGPEQCGKTRAAKQYTEANNHGRTLMLELSGGSQSGIGDFLWAIADQLGVPYTVRMREKRLRIRHALTACDLVLIDEAHLMKKWTLRQLADFWDYLRTDIYANGERGVVFLVTNEAAADSILIEQLRRLKGNGYNIGQLLGRMRNEVLTIDGVEDITPEDVELFVHRYYKPGKKVLRDLHRAATLPQRGHLGLIDEVMKSAWADARVSSRPLDDAIVSAALAKSMSLMKERKDLYR